MARRQARRLIPGVHPQLVEDPGDVVLGAVEGDAESLADLVVGLALGDEVEHAPLGVGQVVESGARGGAASHRASTVLTHGRFAEAPASSGASISVNSSPRSTTADVT